MKRPSARTVVLLLALATGSPSFAQERSKSFSDLTAEERLADLRFLVEQIRTRHPAPHAFTDPSRWESRLEVLERDLGTLDVSGFFFRLQQAAALVDDIHTSVFPLADQGILLATVPVRLRRLGGGIYVRAARGDLAWLVGAQVVEIEGRPIEDVLAMVIGLAPGNQRLRHANVPLAYLLAPETYRYLGIQQQAGKVGLTVKDRGGEVRSVRLDAEPVSLMAAYESGSIVGWKKPEGWVALADEASPATPIFYRRRGQSMVWFEPLPAAEALLVQVNQPLPDAPDSVVTALARLYTHLVANRYRRIVIDLRGNEGGWYSLTSALPGIIASIEAGKDPPRVFVLIGPDTASAGVVLAAQLEQRTDAVFVGEPTGSAPNLYGTYKPAPLPNSGIYYRVSTARLVNSTLEDDRLWIAPDVLVPETIDDVVLGVDGALAAALALPAEDAGAPAVAWHERWRRPSQKGAAAADPAPRRAPAPPP